MSWRDPILRHFTPEIAGVARLTIVADPDELLTEPGLLSALRARGFDLIPYDDDVAFRHAYESRYRRLWDRGQATSLVVVLRALHDDVDTLPWDLIAQARRHHRLLKFSTGDLFPNLAPKVIAELSRTELDTLYEAQQRHQPEPAGENTTRDFILRHVLGVAPELLTTPADLLRVLLRRHVHHQPWPVSLEQRFLHLLRHAGRFEEWPLERLISDRSAFMRFLQERWPIFVRQVLTDGRSQVSALDSAYDIREDGPELLPFDHDDVRGYVISLFTDGVLTPTRTVARAAVDGTWLDIGVAGDDAADAERRLERLTGSLSDGVPPRDADYGTWLEFARRWAEWTALRWTVSSSIEHGMRASLDVLQSRIDELFENWMLDHYATLNNVPPWPRPVMVHHVPHFLAHGWKPASPKIALLVVDGLAISQWIPLRDSLRLGSIALDVEEGGVFAWVPTLTSVSRQAIFAGTAPFFFAASIWSTAREEHYWRRFWGDRGLGAERVAYVKQNATEIDEAFLERVRAAAGQSTTRALGIVVGRVDQMLHGTVTGAAGLHAQIQHWSATRHFEQLIHALIERGWRIYLTADHGNVEANGIGKPNVGVVAEARGERAHIFADDLMCQQVHEKFANSLRWPDTGLPVDTHVLLAGRRAAFITAGGRTVAHGGIALEEVVVPFIRIQGRP